jgi:hypothetical protein
MRIEYIKGDLFSTNVIQRPLIGIVDSMSCSIASNLDKSFPFPVVIGLMTPITTKLSLMPSLKIYMAVTVLGMSATMLLLSV